MAESVALTFRNSHLGQLISAISRLPSTNPTHSTVNLDFLPAQGLLFAVNGRLLGAPIPGEDFYGALLRVFVGELVSDDRLRAGLLGKPG